MDLECFCPCLRKEQAKEPVPPDFDVDQALRGFVELLNEMDAAKSKRIPDVDLPDLNKYKTVEQIETAMIDRITALLRTAKKGCPALQAEAAKLEKRFRALEDQKKGSCLNDSEFLVYLIAYDVINAKADDSANRVSLSQMKAHWERLKREVE